jgi:hypothetical protein
MLHVALGMLLAYVMNNTSSMLLDLHIMGENSYLLLLS